MGYAKLLLIVIFGILYLFFGLDMVTELITAPSSFANFLGFALLIAPVVVGANLYYRKVKK